MADELQQCDGDNVQPVIEDSGVMPRADAQLQLALLRQGLDFRQQKQG